MYKDTYAEGMFKLGNKYLDEYKDGVFQFEMIVKYSSIRGCLLAVYSIMVGRKQLVRIEDQDPAVKKADWEQLKGFCVGLNKEQCKDFVRCVCALNALAARREGKA